MIDYEKLTEEEMERLLTLWGIKPRIDEKGVKWYHREDFEDVWKYIENKDKSH